MYVLDTLRITDEYQQCSGFNYFQPRITCSGGAMTVNVTVLPEIFRWKKLICALCVSQGRKVQEGLRSIPPFGELSSKGVKNMKFENLVVRSQAGSDPKPKVTSKGINFPKDYNELIEQVHSSNLIRVQSRGL